MPAIDPPRPIGDMYSLVHQGIDAIGRGDEAALAQLARLTAEVPRWVRLHLEMEHTYPSPSGVTRCRLAQWYDARGMKPEQESPLGWKVRRAMANSSSIPLPAATQSGPGYP